MASLVCPDHPSPVEDAEAIRKACQGWGTDEKTIVKILGHRNAVQRKLIRQAYGDLYKEDLVKRLESELSGHLERIVYRWMLDPEDRDAVILNVAIKQREIPDYRAIIEFCRVYLPDELLAVKRAYLARYKHSVEEDLAIHTSGKIRNLLVGLVGTYRYAGDDINVKLAKSEAEILNNAVKEKAFDHEEVIRIVTTRSNAQILATLNHFRDEHGSSITKHLKGETGNDYLTALRTIFRSVSDPKRYYVKVLRHALNKPGTDEDELTRVIVTRADKDLRVIKELYQKRNNVTLEHAISKETSGDYKDFLQALLGKED